MNRTARRDIPVIVIAGLMIALTLAALVMVAVKSGAVRVVEQLPLDADRPRVLLQDELEHYEDSVHHTLMADRKLHFTSGLVGRGAWVDKGDRLVYPAFPTIDVRAARRFPRHNFSPPCGTVDFWHRPDYPSGDGKRHVLFYVSGGVEGKGRMVERANTIMLEKTAAGVLQLTLISPAGLGRRAWRVSHPHASWKRREWHHFALAWQQGAQGRAAVFFDGEAASRDAPGFVLEEIGADLSFGGADGQLISRGAFDRIRSWEGWQTSFGELETLRQAAMGNDSTYAGLLVNDPLEDAELTALAGHGKVMGQRALPLAQLRKMGAKGRQLRRQYMNDGYVAAGYAGRGFALREERIKGQDKPPRLLYPTRILGGALWQQSSIWPPRGSFELFYKPDPDAAGRRRVIFQLDQTTTVRKFPERRESPALMSWVIDAENRLALTFRLRNPAPASLTSAPIELKPGRWVHLACAWDLARGHLAQFVDGKAIAGRVQLPGDKPLRLSGLPVGVFLDVGHAYGRDVLRGVIDGLKIHDQAKDEFPAARGVIFQHSFSSRWSNVADYAEGERIAFGLADPDVDGRTGSGVRVAGRARLYFLSQYVLNADRPIPIGNIDPNRGTASLWVKPSDQTLDGTRRMLLYLRLRGWSMDAVALQLEQGRLRLHVARLADVATSPLKWKAGTWRHVAITWDRHAAAAAVYLNGKLEGKSRGARSGTALSRPRYPPSEWWSLGSGETDSQTAQATFDELTIYRRVLTAKEIAALALPLP